MLLIPCRRRSSNGHCAWIPSEMDGYFGFHDSSFFGASVRHAHGDAAEQRFAVGGRDREDPLRHDESGPAMSRQTLGSHSVWLPRALTTSLGHYQHKQPRRPPHNPPKTPVFTRFRVTTRVTINVAQMVAVTY